MSTFKKTESKTDDLVHAGFEIGLLLKGIDGILEIAGGIILIFLSPSRLGWLAHLLTQHELSEDPKDIVANALMSLSSSFSVSAQHFGVFYLMSHGIVKCILILLLWRRKLWAYPVSMLALILFAAYQIYRYTIEQSVFLVFLTILDIAMIILTYLEYRKMKLSKH